MNFVYLSWRNRIWKCIKYVGSWIGLRIIWSRLLGPGVRRIWTGSSRSFRLKRRSIRSLIERSKRLIIARISKFSLLRKSGKYLISFYKSGKEDLNKLLCSLDSKASMILSMLILKIKVISQPALKNYSKLKKKMDICK